MSLKVFVDAKVVQQNNICILNNSSMFNYAAVPAF